MTTEHDFIPPLPRNPRMALRQLRERERSRGERFIDWLEPRLAPLGPAIEWAIVLAVIASLIAAIAYWSRDLDGDLDVSAKVVADADARARAVMCANVP